jgi:membrane-associated phospholipid phosphatase
VIRKIVSSLRPADSLNLSFLFFLTFLVLFFRQAISDACQLAALYSLLFVFQVLLVRFGNRNGLLGWMYDLIFPTITILIVFDSLGKIVHCINPHDIDPLLIRLDYAIFGFYPTVMIERWMRPGLTDVMQLAYSSYYFLPLTLGVMLKMTRKDGALGHSLFLIMLCFYLSYVGYMLMPALGPRYTMAHLQHAELRGFLIAGPIQNLLNGLEGIKRDAFPSGHTGVALTVLYLSYLHARGLFRLFLPFVLALIVSTVYCRYHYVVDVLGGGVLAGITIIVGELYYGYRAERVDTDR